MPLYHENIYQTNFSFRKLFSQLEKFKAQTSGLPESERSAEDGITFQFKYRPEQAHLSQTNRLAELERRIHRLEVVLGASDDKLSRLSTLTSKGNNLLDFDSLISYFFRTGSLLEAAQHLSATASLLDSAQLDHIEGRLTALTQKLESIAESKKQLSADVEGDRKVSYNNNFTSYICHNIFFLIFLMFIDITDK